MKNELINPIDILNLTDWEKEQLKSLELLTVGDILGAPEVKLQEAHASGEIKACRIKNVAIAAVFESLSG